MKVALVTSEVTFVPRNYNDFILPLAESDEIHALVIMRNKSWKFLLQSLLLILSLAAPRLGWTLFSNIFGFSVKKRIELYKNKNKLVYFFDNPNSPEFIAWLKREKIDLVLNARTRFIFNRELLSTPKMGCINIHHGLLPDQRGLMCDFWAHLDNRPIGFSIHQMTEKLDAGQIYLAQEVNSNQKCYLKHLAVSSQVESMQCQKLLASLAKDEKILTIDNIKTEQTKYFKNPTLKDLYRMRKKGIRI